MCLQKIYSHSSCPCNERNNPADIRQRSAALSWIQAKKNNVNTNYGIALKYLSGPNLSVLFKSYEAGYSYRPRTIYSYSISHYYNALVSTYDADYLNVNEIGTQLVGAFIEEDISYLGGWLGDCVIGDNGSPSLKGDDYISDLDAENIYRMIVLGQGIVSAASSYYDSVLNHSNRAIVFQSYMDYETARNKIYYYLIDIELIAQIERARQNDNAYLELYYTELLTSEEYHQNELISKYGNTYMFLQALAANRSTLTE